MRHSPVGPRARAAFAWTLIACGAAPSSAEPAAPVTTSAPRAAPLWLHLYETSDRHGNLESAPLLGARLERLRASDEALLLLDGGDLFTGTLESDLGEGAPVIRAMNALGYDAVAVGNHDFDFGPVGASAVATKPNDDPR